VPRDLIPWLVIYFYMGSNAVTFIHCSGLADAKSYILISQLPADVYSKYVEDVNTTHLTGFTFVILGVVHLAGGKIPEGIFSVINFQLSQKLKLLGN
jgi:hypothetical protein